MEYLNKIIQGDCLEELCILEKRYIITKLGIIDKKRNKPVKFTEDYKGYLKARLYTTLSKHPDKRKPFRLHRILAMKFIPNYSKDLQVNHINGIKNDNRLENLEMVTNSENAKHGWSLLRNKKRIKKLNRDKNGKFIKK